MTVEITVSRIVCVAAVDVDVAAVTTEAPLALETSILQALDTMVAGYLVSTSGIEIALFPFPAATVDTTLIVLVTRGVTVVMAVAVDTAML